MTVKEALLSIVNYPVPDSAIENIAETRGLGIDDTITSEIRSLDSFKLAEADVFRWVSFAPNVVQGGIQFNLLVPDRERLRERANITYKKLGDANCDSGIRKVFTFLADDI